MTRRSDKLKQVFSQPTYIISLFIVIFLSFFAMTAEIWSHDEPLLIYRDQTFYFPLLKPYSAEELNLKDVFVIDYKDLKKQDEKDKKSAFYLFPINPYSPFEQTTNILSPPSSLNWLGTDALGRDILARVLYGIRTSLSFGILTCFFSTLFAILIGTTQGYFGGLVDLSCDRAKEIIMMMPALTLILILGSLYSNLGILVIALILSLFSWTGLASQLRAQTYLLKELSFCETARCLGGSSFYTIRKHIFPNLTTIILMTIPFEIQGGMSMLAALDYLGFGVQPPTPSLGELLAQGQPLVMTAPWIILGAVIPLILILSSFVFIGQGLRKALETK